MLGHFWYLSALLVMLPLFYAALVKSKKFFLYVGFPLSAILINGYFSTTGLLRSAHDWLGLFKSALPRAWAGLCLGAVAYLLADRLRRCPQFTRFGKWLLSFVELGCLAASLIYMAKSKATQLDFLFMAAFVTIIAISMSGRAPVRAIFPASFKWLADYSLVLYLCHWTFATRLTTALMPDKPWQERVLPYLLFSILYALLWMGIFALVKKMKLPEKMRRALFSRDAS